MQSDEDTNLILLHYNAIPILIEFIKECMDSSTDASVRRKALLTLNQWDKARTPSRKNYAT